MKVVINKCFGGFSLSKEAMIEIYKRGGKGVRLLDPSEYYGSSEDWEKKLKEDQSKEWGPDIYEEKVLHSEYSNTYKGDLRNCPVLVSVVEEMGEKANGGSANLKVVEIPDDVEYGVDDYDGMNELEADTEWRYETSDGTGGHL